MKRLALGAVIVLAGCGGTSHPQSSPKPPHIPSALAQAWENEATAVADALGRNDCQAALDQANRLRDDVSHAVQENEIPARLETILVPAVNALPGQIGDCHPTPPPKPPKQHDHGKHKGRGDEG